MPLALLPEIEYGRTCYVLINGFKTLIMPVDTHWPSRIPGIMIPALDFLYVLHTSPVGYDGIESG